MLDARAALQKSCVMASALCATLRDRLAPESAALPPVEDALCQRKPIASAPYPLQPARIAQKKPQNKKPLQLALTAVFKSGGVDGTRTRDPRRDRPVF